MTLPVKPINEIEVKSEVSASDKILILDSESEEARLASKDELKGDKGDQGEPGTPGADGQDGAAATIAVGTTSTLPAGSLATVSNSGTSSAAVFNFGIPKGDKGDQGEPGVDGQDGADGQDGQDGVDGNGITSVTSSKVGKTTTVTMNFDEGDPFSFQVQDGADGQGAGDVLGPSSSTDGNVVLFDGTTGKLIKDSGKTIPTQASDVNALPSSTKYGASLTVAIDSSDYKITTTLKDQDGNTLGTAQVIDLPLESVVVGGSYDDQTKKVILTLQNGNTIEFSVADLVSGLQSEITSSNKLDADLVDDSTSTNKFVTANDKTTWGGKQDALTLPSTPTQGNLVVRGANNKTIADGGAIPTGVPNGGNNGDVLTNVNGTPTWAAPSGGIENVTTGTTSTVTGIWAGSEAEHGSITPSGTVLYFVF